MGIGWNLGNSLDPGNCTWVSNELEYETTWDNGELIARSGLYWKTEGLSEAIMGAKSADAAA